MNVNSDRLFGYVMFIFFILIAILSTWRLELYKKEVARLDEKIKHQYVEIHDYEWMTDQYSYMFNKYCGGMNDGKNKSN